MSNVATKSRVYSMYKEMCSTGRQILSEFDMWNYTNEQFYTKLLRKTDSKLKQTSAYIKKEEANEGKILITNKVKVTLSKIGEIESISVEYPDYNTKVYIIGKKNYALSEIYFTKYIVENSSFDNANKYILILTRNKEREKNICRFKGINIKVINGQFLEEVKESVKRAEYVENKILPEFEKYLELFNGNKVTPKNIDGEICSGFIQYLKTRQKYED